MLESGYGIKGVHLHSGQDIEDFIAAHGGRWPVRGYAYIREVIYHRKRDGGVTTRYVPTLFISCNRTVSKRIAVEDEGFSNDYTSDLSTYSSEELGYF